ncbi:MAG: glycosyl transferase, group 2 family protein [Xanthobacteraceae bacterium]|jgi:hypothetical protein|nr:glycosyl transferase, group 2 family protein [Xanthobacteraceae bacterium]
MRSGRLSSVSLIVLVKEALPDRALLDRLLAVLGTNFTDVETIFVADGSTAAVRDLKGFVATVPDATCLVLVEWLDSEAASLVGMENAVCDHVLLLSLTEAAVAAVPEAIERIRAGYDAVFDHAVAVHDTVIHRAAYDLLSSMTGAALKPSPVELGLMQREAALYLLSKQNAEVLLKARTCGPGFAATEVALAEASPEPENASSVRARAGKALRLAISLGAAPVRLLGLAAMLASALSLVYAAYVVLVFLFKPDVEAGWTTLSLQMAGMMFLFSLMFWLLSEYVVQIHAATGGRRRRTVVRELRSEMTARSGRLNVVDETGAFRLGAPEAATTGGD